MNSNWKAGDKALCVDAFIGVVKEGAKRVFNAPEIPLPVKGTTYLVTDVYICPVEKSVNLALSGWDWVDVFDARRFRKVVPACDQLTQKETGLIPHEGFWQSRPDL